MVFFLFAISVALPGALRAQAPPSPFPVPPVAGLNEQQRMGRILFFQNCSLCHLPYKTEDKTGKSAATVGPFLNGLFTREKPLNDAVVRTFMTRGIPQKMPSFQWALTPKEMDQIISYLKVY